MRKIYLIRHAQSEENVLSWRRKTSVHDFNEMLRRSPDTPLTGWGKVQAELLIQRLKSTNIACIYTSPFDRALQTATILGDELHITPQQLHDLREVLPQQLKESDNKQEPLAKLFAHSYMRMVLPGSRKNGEKLRDGYRRAQRVWAQLLNDPAQEIAIVSHYGFLSLLLIVIERNRHWRVIARDLSNGGISVVVSKDRHA